jgi:hypothetical protein
MLKLASAALAALFLALSPAAAEPRALPTLPAKLTTPAALTQDSMADTVGTPAGFVVAWRRDVITGTDSRVLLQQFDSTGRPKPIVTLQTRTGPIVGRPQLVYLPGGKAAVFWDRNGMIRGAIVDLITNRVVLQRDIAVPGDIIHDAVRLTDGRIGLVFVGNSVTREILKVTTLNPATLATVLAPRAINGTGFPIDPWNAFDHTISPAGGGGGIAFWYDRAANRASGKIFGRVFTATGVVGAIFQLNTTRTPFPFLSDHMAEFEIKAARLTDGRTAVAWTSKEGTVVGTQWEVRVRILDAAGRPLGTDFVPYADKSGNQRSPEIVPLPNGRFAIAWVERVIPTVTTNLEYSVYTSTGQRIRDSVRTHSGSSLSESLYNEYARLADGSLVRVSDNTFTHWGLTADGIPAP